MCYTRLHIINMHCLHGRDSHSRSLSMCIHPLTANNTLRNIDTPEMHCYSLHASCTLQKVHFMWNAAHPCSSHFMYHL